MKLEVQSVREVRVIDSRPAEQRGASMFGPALDIELRCVLPEGTKVAGHGQPTAITATDSTGADLTKVDPDIFGDIEYLRLDSNYDDVYLLKLRLTPTARRATTFSVHAEALVTTYSGIDRLEVAPTGDWTPLKHPSLAEFKAEYMFTMTDGRATFSVRPPAAREVIEAIVPASAGDEPTGYSVSWSEDQADFSVDPAPQAGEKLVLRVKSGVQTAPVVIDLKDQPLP